MLARTPPTRQSRPGHLLPRGRRRRSADGQSLAEFALVLTPLALLLLGIIQMGLVFNAYVTLSNATREAARSASVYVYDRSLSKSQNDVARERIARDTLTQSMGLLARAAPQLVPADQTVTYTVPSGVSETDARAGQQITVHAHYHLDLVVPFVSVLLPLESGRLPLDAEVTMVVN